jgi:hypothetical protein
MNYLRQPEYTILPKCRVVYVVKVEQLIVCVQMLGLIIMVMGIFKMNVHNFLNQLPRTVAKNATLGPILTCKQEFYCLS